MGGSVPLLAGSIWQRGELAVNLGKPALWIRISFIFRAPGDPCLASCCTAASGVEQAASGVRVLFTSATALVCGCVALRVNRELIDFEGIPVTLARSIVPLA